VSEQLAVGALAARRGRDLAAEGVAVVPIGGAGNIRRFLERIVEVKAEPSRSARLLAG
jgi:hypothetical protein